MTKAISTSDTVDSHRCGSKKRIAVSIMAAVHEDIPEIADLAARAFSDRFGHMMSSEELKQFLQENYSASYFENSFDDTDILVARYGRRIAGYTQCGLVQTPKIPGGPDDREIVRIYVETGLQGQGCGRQLMEAVLTEPSMMAAPNIFLKVWGENKQAITLYGSYSFEVINLNEGEIAGELARDLIMVRPQ